MKTTTPHIAGGFTLVEILTVVGIILILGALIAPQRLETSYGRSLVSRVKSDQRSLATAIETYYVDNNEYPAMANGARGANARLDGGAGAHRMCTFRLRNDTLLHTLSTPISYITSLFSDPFADSRGAVFGYRQFSYTWILISYGPDRDETESVSDHYNTVCVTKLGQNNSVDLNFEPTFVITIAQPSTEYLATPKSVGSGQALIYDPTNGTTSEGDIVRIKQ